MRVLVFAACCAVLRAQPESECQAEKAQVSAVVAERDLAKQELEALKVAQQAEVSKLQEELSVAKRAATELEAKAKQAEADASKSQEELRVAKAAAADVDASISISRDLLSLASMSSDAIEHLLEQTDLDERVAAEASKHLQSARTFTSEYASQLSSIDYQGKAQEVVSQLTSHPVYLTHVAPHVDTVLAQARPHLEMVSKQAAPHLETARAQYAAASEAVLEGAIPALQHGLERASKVSEHLEVPKRKAAELVETVFNAAAKVAPKHSKALPASTVDRMLLLVVLSMLAFNILAVFPRVAKAVLRIFFVAFRFFVLFPLSLLRKIFAVLLYVSTGFYCCGLCRKRKPSGTKDVKVKNAKGNDNVPAATVEELTQMLEAAKKKGKLDAGVDQLVTQAKKGKTVTIPKTNEAKRVLVDSLKKALAQFKEVNVKKLGL